MIVGVGTDLVDVRRIEAALDRFGDRFAHKLLSEEEFHEYKRSTNPAKLLAKRFAVKEAAAKALGTGFRLGVSWQDFEIRHNELGAPCLSLHGKAEVRAKQLNMDRAWLSISDERTHAVATVILEKGV